MHREEQVRNDLKIKLTAAEDANRELVTFIKTL